MNINKVQLEAQLVIKEEVALKCMEFATEYMLKKAEYRLLNPLHPYSFDIRSVHKQSQLMAELNAYSFVKQLPPLYRSKIQDLSGKATMEGNSANLNKVRGSKSPQREKNDRWQKHKLVIEQESEQIVLQRTSSEIIDKQSQKGSVSSKKSKSKFQKVKKNTKPKIQQQVFPGVQFDFKKKSVIQPEQKPIQESPIIKKTDINSDSDDSFDNFPLTNSKQNEQGFQQKQRESLNSSDLNSYHSFILQEKRMQIDIVSEHLSEHEMSCLSQSANFRPEIKQHKNPSKSRLSQNHKSRNQYRQQNENNLADQDQLQNQIINDSQAVKNQEQIKQRHQQIQNYLMKLQSFEVQQQILMKKLMKVWSKESQCIKKIKGISWEGLQLPKKSFKFQTFQYASVIQ